MRDLLASDYNVFVAADGQGALEQLRARPCDLLVTDLMMPRASGRDLVQAVRADDVLRAIPILVLTARTAVGARIDSLDSGADDYIAKPFDASELRARIRSLLRIKDYQDTIRAQADELSQWNRTLNDRVRQQVQQIEGLRRNCRRSYARCRRRDPGLCRPLMMRGAGSSVTCTTAPSSGSQRWG